MLQKINNHRHLGYASLYAITFLSYGTHISALGPFIPYLTATTGIIQTDYSYLFSCRSFTMVLGAFLTKYLQRRKMTNHNMLVLACLLITIFSFLFSQTTSSLWLGIWLSLISIGYSLLEIILNVCVLLTNDPQDIEFWLLVTHGIFGVGGLIGPYLIFLFQNQSYSVFGLLIAFSIPFFMKLKSPELTDFIPEKRSSSVINSRRISDLLEYAVCLLMFFYLGMEITYGGWISSFATLTKITDNRGATVFPTIFWTFMTLFRFILIFVPGKSSSKLNILIISNIASGILSLLIVYAGYIQLACYLSGIMFGVSMSSIYPLILTFPIESGLSIQDTQTSNIIMAGVVSQGILTMFVGWMMNIIHVNMLFYSLSFFGVMMWLIRIYCSYLIQQQKKSMKESQICIELRENVKQKL